MVSITPHFIGLVEMGLLFFLVISLVFTIGSPVKEIPQASCSASFIVDQHEHQLNSSAIHLTLHHPHSPCSPQPLPRPPLSETLKHDEFRVRYLTSRLTGNPSSNHSSSLHQDSVAVPLKPGISLGVGNYIAYIGLGTPTTSYAMVVDTGSSLTWLQCFPCRISCHPQSGPLFNPSTSTTYHPVSCSAAECGGLPSATLNPSACSRKNVCIYQASYGDSSYSAGYLSRDALTLGSTKALPDFVYGCGQDNQGLFGRAAGLIALARNKLSMLSQLSFKFGNSFSYCLPTSASTGFLSIGSYDPSKVAFTPMLMNRMDNTMYFVRLTSIIVGRRALPVAASVYVGTPTIIDSGTVISRLPPAVYAALSKAIAGALVRHPRAPGYSILDTCFKGSARGLPVPEVRMVFAGGAELRLPARNVLIDVEEGSTACLSFASAGGVAIIGNRQQQTFRVVYDVGRSRIGFAAGGCG